MDASMTDSGRFSKTDDDTLKCWHLSRGTFLVYDARIDAITVMHENGDLFGREYPRARFLECLKELGVLS